MNAVNIVTINKLLPLYKGIESARAIELATFAEVGYEIVVGKGLYEVGDRAVLAMPDHNVPDTKIFRPFTRPQGDPNKSMLGKVDGVACRIRAKKFTLSKAPSGDAVYSNGILLPIAEVEAFIGKRITNKTDLAKELGVVKYAPPEHGGVQEIAGALPEGLHSTNETNINDLWEYLDRNSSWPLTLIGTEKIDGSSITIGVTEANPEGFICSRNFSKRIFVRTQVGVRPKTVLERLCFWKSPDLAVYTTALSTDDFVKYGKPLLNNLVHSDIVRGVAFRGELHGSTMKGSGNKHNPAAKVANNIKLFGADLRLKTGQWVPACYDDFKKLAAVVGATTVPEVFAQTFKDKQQLIDTCNEYFKVHKIEGIVVRTLDQKFSAKVMNLEYDSKK